MEKLYLYEKEIDVEIIKSKLNERLSKLKMYKTEYKDESLLIETKYIIYPFIHGKLKNINYFIVKENYEKNGVIDGEYTYISSDFLLNELKRDSFVLCEKTIDEFDVYNIEIIDYSFKKFLNELNERLEKGICDRHNLRLSNKNNKLDVGLIKEFDLLEKDYYLEQVYQITYIDGSKKSYKSIYSSLKDDFYEFDFVKNESFIEYLKLYRKPIVSIPKRYIDEYYKLSYKIYLNVNEELKYITKESLFNKAKENIKYKKNVQYYDYLDKLIFYFKRGKYLSLFELKENNLKYKIFYYYLTLRFIGESGYSLAMLTKMGIIEDDYLKLLEISAKLNDTNAKKCLLEYYNSPKNYNESRLKRYI